MAEKKVPFAVKHPQLDVIAVELKALQELRKIKADQWKSMKDGFGEINTFIDKGGIEEALVKPFERGMSRIEKEIEGTMAPMTSLFDEMIQSAIGMFDPIFKVMRDYFQMGADNWEEISKRAGYWLGEWLENISRRAAVQEFEMLQLTEEYKKGYEDYMWEVGAKRRYEEQRIITGRGGHLEW